MTSTVRRVADLTRDLGRRSAISAGRSPYTVMTVTRTRPMQDEQRGFDTPEEAALEGFSAAASCRVLASHTQGDVAYVLLDTHADGWPYLYGVNCYRKEGRWHDGSSGNGGGW